MAKYIIVIGLQTLICFAYALSLFLRGRWKLTIESVLGLSIFALAALAFILLGWKWGVALLLTPFVFVGISRGPAQMLAQKLLGYRTGADHYGGYDVLSELTKGKGFDQVMATGFDREETQNRARLEKIARRPEIDAVLGCRSVSFGDYCDIFRWLWNSALHDLAWEIVSSPVDLGDCIDMRSAGRSDREIWAHFREID